MMIEQLVTKKVNSIPFKYNPETKLFFNHIEEKWMPKIDRSRTNDAEYAKFKTWNMERFNDYIEMLSKYSDVLKESNTEESKLKKPRKVSGAWRSKYDEYISSLEIPNLDQFIDIKFTLPVGISDAVLLAAINDYREESQDNSIKLDVDYAKAILSTIIITLSQYKTSIRKTYHYGNEKRYHEKAGFVQCSWDLLRHTCTNSYPKYLKALTNAGIIECDNKYMNWGDNKKALSYKINDIYFEDPHGLNRVHKIEKIKNYHIKYTMVKFKVTYREKQRAAQNDFQSKMMDNVEELLSPINADKLMDDLNKDKFSFYNVANNKELDKKLKKSTTYTVEELGTTIKSIQSGNIYFNVSDSFGGRFHSPFTNLKSDIRKYVEHKGSKYMNVDICNSQMTVLAAIMNNPEVAKQLLKGVEFSTDDDQSTTDLINAVDLIKNLEDVKDFCDKTKDGLIYENVADYMGISRQQAKISLISVIFSNSAQFVKLKDKIKGIYPSIVELSNKLNQVDGLHYLPMLCQRFESQLFINTIVKEFFNHKKHPAITIHDSIMVHPEDYDTFMSVYDNEFKKLGLEPFKLKTEKY